MSSQRLAGKVVLLTGGSGGQGLAGAELFTREGAAVVIADVTDDPGRVCAAALRKRGLRASYAHLDVTSVASWRRVLALVRRRYGALHVLVNGAGIISRLGIMATPLAVWDRVLDVNLKGALLGMRLAAPLMKASGGGSIVNICSIGALVGNADVSYSASKWGLRGITKTAALEFLDWGIRANSVFPSQVSGTGMTAAAAGQAEINAKTMPAGRLARPDEVMQAVLFLASDESTYINGTEIVVDSGYTSIALARMRRMMASAGLPAARAPT